MSLCFDHFYRCFPCKRYTNTKKGWRVLHQIDITWIIGYVNRNCVPIVRVVRLMKKENAENTKMNGNILTILLKWRLNAFAVWSKLNQRNTCLYVATHPSHNAKNGNKLQTISLFRNKIAWACANTWKRYRIPLSLTSFDAHRRQRPSSQCLTLFDSDRTIDRPQTVSMNLRIFRIVPFLSISIVNTLHFARNVICTRCRSSRIQIEIFLIYHVQYNLASDSDS